MPARTADIGAATRSAQIETWSNATIRARYPSARDGAREPAAGLFDNAADAQAAVQARGQLIGVERRRFKVVLSELWWPSAEFSTVTLIDPEQGLSSQALITRLEVDLENEQTLLEVMV